jgi:hypothetical protein
MAELRHCMAVGKGDIRRRVKSLTKANLSQQMRLGLGQVLAFADLLAIEGDFVVPVLVVEFEPPDERWPALCERHGVALVWPSSFDRLERVLRRYPGDA